MQCNNFNIIYINDQHEELQKQKNNKRDDR